MKLYRASGLPIKQEHIDAKSAEIKRHYDELEKLLGPATPKNVKEYQKLLEKAESQIAKDYPISIEIEYPQAEAQMKELLIKYNCISFCYEDDELICYIMDA